MRFFRDKVQNVPFLCLCNLCTHGTCHQSQWRLQSLGVTLGGTGVPGPPRCLNQTPSMGREAFAHRLPQAALTPPPVKQRHYGERTPETHDGRGKKGREAQQSTQEESTQPQQSTQEESEVKGKKEYRIQVKAENKMKREKSGRRETDQ